MRHVACGLLVLVWLITSVGCQRKIPLGEDGGDQGGKMPPEMLDDHRRHERLAAGKEVDNERAMEARQYLAPNQSKNGMSAVTREQALKWANDFYQAGAPKVYAIYAPGEKKFNLNLCGALLVELPTQAGQRAQVFNTYNRIDKEIQAEAYEHTKDQGQKFLELNLE